MKMIHTLSLATFLVCSPLVAKEAPVRTTPVTKAEQAAMTPDSVLAALMRGNERFVSGKPTPQDVTVRIAESVQGQYPKAVILSCLDSRVPVEKVFDMSIGDVFVGRVAGNIQNEDMLGSMEFATKLAGAKLVMVLGHTECGAVKGAIDNAKLGNLTHLLDKIKPSIQAVKGFEAKDRTSSNKEFVAKAIEQNVHDTVDQIRRNSPVLAELEKEGKIKIIGAYYDLHTGKVSLLK